MMFLRGFCPPLHRLAASLGSARSAGRLRAWPGGRGGHPGCGRAAASGTGNTVQVAMVGLGGGHDGTRWWITNILFYSKGLLSR